MKDERKTACFHGMTTRARRVILSIFKDFGTRFNSDVIFLLTISRSLTICFRLLQCILFLVEKTGRVVHNPFFARANTVHIEPGQRLYAYED